MSNYKKFSLQTIKEKLKNGEYASLVGANRAIGKTQELSEDDKVKARAIAAKFFGAEVPKKAAAKPAKKAVAKKAAKKVTKKATKKVAKKAVKQAKERTHPSTHSGRAGAGAPRAKKSAKKAAKKAARSESASAPTSAALRPAESAAPKTKSRPLRASADVVMSMGKVISTIGDAIKSMETAKHLFPKAELEQNVEAAAGSMAKAVRVIDREVLDPLLNEQAEATGGKKAAKKGKGSRKAATAPAEDEGNEPSAVANGAADPANLSEEEQRQLALALETKPRLGGAVQEE
jgi:hypothetical protein